MRSGTSGSIRWFRALVTTMAPARANACSMGPATSASRAEKTIRPGKGGAQSRITRPATCRGSGVISLQRTTSSYGFPALADEAATAATSNQGWSASNRTNFWPTVPVAPRIETGIRSAMTIPREQVGSQPHIQLDALKQVRLPDVFLTGVRYPDSAGPELVAFAPGIQKRKIAGVAHHGCLPSLRGAASLVEGKLHP